MVCYTRPQSNLHFGLMFALPFYDANVVTILQIRMPSLHRKKQAMMKKQLKKKSS